MPTYHSILSSRASFSLSFVHLEHIRFGTMTLKKSIEDDNIQIEVHPSEKQYERNHAKSNLRRLNSDYACKTLTKIDF